MQEERVVFVVPCLIRYETPGGREAAIDWITSRTFEASGVLRKAGKYDTGRCGPVTIVGEQHCAALAAAADRAEAAGEQRFSELLNDLWTRFV